MKKAFYLFNILIFLVCCSPKQENVERIIENDVEVIINQLEPYEIKGEPSTLNLEEEFTIDSERDDIAELGLADIGFWYDIDSKGNIYLLDFRGASDIWVFKFDKTGKFLSSFGKKGQGPGEFQRPRIIKVTNEDEIAIVDGSMKLVILDKDGELIREISTSTINGLLIPLNKERYLLAKTIRYPSEDIESRFSYHLCNVELKELKELASVENPNSLKVNRLDGVQTIPIFHITEKSIFVGDPKKGYEIFEYDFDGKLLRKIRKEYKHVVVPEEYKKRFLKMFERPDQERYRKIAYFPKHLPPFQFFFADDGGNLFVMTYEKGSSPRKYIYDIFNENGIFIARTQLENISIDEFSEVPLNVKARSGRLYCLREKEDGYKELVVYRMKWE